MDIREIQKGIIAGTYRLTLHAEDERDADTITIAELEAAFSGVDASIIEEYPEDPRGASCLCLGFTPDRKPIHAVCSLKDTLIVIITVYRPDPRKWIGWRKRK